MATGFASALLPSISSLAVRMSRDSRYRDGRHRCNRYDRCGMGRQDDIESSQRVIVMGKMDMDGGAA